MASRPTTDTTQTARAPLRVDYEFDFCLPSQTRFASLMYDGAAAHFSDASWPTSATTIDPVLPFAVSSFRRSGSETAVLDLGGVFGAPCFAMVTVAYGTAHASIAVGDLPALGEVERWLRDALPEAQAAEREIPVSFWTAGSHGAARRIRRLEVPRWDEIAGNYSEPVRRHLAHLMTSYRPSASGQLLLWYGEPGTGKTYALRALAWEWREWCELHYVTDPETFFGRHTEYLLDVLLQNADEDDEEAAPKWRLLVLEDTGELLAADAKEQTGQGLSRLLNLVDGIIGQGLRVLVLVTTNEPLRRLHPAVARTGRCASRLEFVPFTPEEAARWLEERGAADGHSPAGTLANLFARADGEESEPDRPIGFIR